jgi:uncharacterized protein
MSNVMTLRRDSNPWYREPWPWILMAGPAIVIVAGFVTAWLAIVSNDGLVADDYYKQGLALNQRLQRDHYASDLGLRADFMRSGQQVRLMVAAERDAALPEALTLKLSHPTRAGQDQMVKMVSEGQGFYGGKLSADISGRWYVSIEDPAGKWRLQGEWQADDEAPLRLAARPEK